MVLKQLCVSKKLSALEFQSILPPKMCRGSRRKWVRVRAAACFSENGHYRWSTEMEERKSNEPKRLSWMFCAKLLLRLLILFIFIAFWSFCLFFHCLVLALAIFSVILLICFFPMCLFSIHFYLSSVSHFGLTDGLGKWYSIRKTESILICFANICPTVVCVSDFTLDFFMAI